MKLSSLSLIYVALSAFMAASILVVHMNYAEGDGATWVAPLSLGALTPASANQADTVMVWSASSAIEM